MIIDFHTHMFPDKIAKGTIDLLAGICKIKPYTDGTFAGLKKETLESEVDLSVALPIVTKPSQFESVNAFASRYQEKPVLSFGSIHPDCGDYKGKLRRIKDMGLKGIKLHPDYQEVYFNDIRYKRIISCAAELDLIVSVHAGADPKYPEDIHCTPRMSAEVIAETGITKLVLAHMGGNEQWDEVEEYLVGRDVYFDTGVVLDRMPEKQFLRIVRNHGADKILFATDSPWGGQKKFLKIMREMPLSDEEREKILGINAGKLLRLPEVFNDYEFNERMVI